ncbi:Rha family transcriptional regulator [Lactiplantibacillus nangangensis]|uniref:Rha family transcriptional regulator n=1 Tax=Lactiplantibacillus nangangensis TaxID=2559917 RepID=A0ABW1SI80_9LACO|nr:Rha family transcriptional regulator [Lactiplantibacillus nangangensis]
MNLVELTSKRLDAEPFTTSDVIAENVGLSHRSLKRTITNHKNRLEHFGKMRTTFTPLSSGQTSVSYQLNERQAMLLFFYLSNTPQVEEFQERLVNQFSSMKRALIEQQAKYELGKVLNKSLATAIKESRIDMHGYEYSTFQRLIYKMALGVSISDLKKARDIKRGELITHYLSADEAQATALIRQRVNTLLDVGMNYQEIKQALSIKGVIYHIQLSLPAKAATR